MLDWNGDAAFVFSVELLNCDIGYKVKISHLYAGTLQNFCTIRHELLPKLFIHCCTKQQEILWCEIHSHIWIYTAGCGAWWEKARCVNGSHLACMKLVFVMGSLSLLPFSFSSCIIHGYDETLFMYFCISIQQSRDFLFCLYCCH